jgi:hypothetical protein
MLFTTCCAVLRCAVLRCAVLCWSGPPSSPKPPRPSSAPPKQRFDPTEYVKQKRQREQQLAAARGGSRGNSPVRPAYYSSSGARSGSSTPRASDAGRVSQGTTGAGRSSSSRERMRAGSFDGSGFADDEGGVGSRQGPSERWRGSSSGNSISAVHSYLRATVSSTSVEGGGSSSRPGSSGRQRPGSSGSSRRDAPGVMGSYGVSERLAGSGSSSRTSRRPPGSLDGQHSAGESAMCRSAHSIRRERATYPSWGEESHWVSVQLL